MDTAKDKIDKELSIGDTCFMPLETIGGNLFTIHPNFLIIYTKAIKVLCQ